MFAMPPLVCSHPKVKDMPLSSFSHNDMYQNDTKKDLSIQELWAIF